MTPTVTVLARVAVAVDRICRVVPLDDQRCQVLFIDAEGRYVAGTVEGFSADELRDAIGPNAEILRW